MTFDPPFRLGPFEVDSEGRLSPVVHEASPAFLFRWRDRVVRSRLALTDATDGPIDDADGCGAGAQHGRQ